MLYIHIPYCKGKCLYCDFYSGGNPDWNRLIKSLLNELALRADELPERLHSIYIGGGTPSLMPPALFQSFMAEIHLILSANHISLAPDCEFTIEVNPEDVDDIHIHQWKKTGVNRISMGIQTLDDNLLNLIRRRHSAQKALHSAKLLRNNFENINFDIMFGIPGQITADIEYTVSKLLDFSPEHFSAYSLMYEQGTALTLLRDQGKVTELPEEISIEMFEIITRILNDAGYEHYEISNYAKPGFRSRHNSGYWTSRPYVGIGPSACSFDGSDVRRNNLPDLNKYIATLSELDLPDYKKPETPQYNILNTLSTTESLSKEERIEETIFTSLRTSDGINLKMFRSDFGDDDYTSLLNKSKKHIKSGNMIYTGDKLVISPQAILLSDSIILDLI